ncbi:hypothetical protein HZB02_07465 [Candidatus Woesearchaeota archaeon]|nr:hypothetical protein [Candidatus Woesearchaeota archaeon]
MTQENLLKKVRESLSHPEIILFKAIERNAYSETSDYGYRFEIAPCQGVYHLDVDTNRSLMDLRNRVFEEMLVEAYGFRRVDFEGLSSQDWGVLDFDFKDDHWDPKIFYTHRLMAVEPVGIRKERTDAYKRHFHFHILPEFSAEFSEEDQRDAYTENYKPTTLRKSITRNIEVVLFPCIEYLKILDDLQRERQAIHALQRASGFRQDHDRLKKIEEDIGFVEKDTIHVPAYNKFFSR